ncbi:MAG: hypothetical protein LQ340_004654 [Diploschistes diacapsis]|nr:MAG: hypothetical protein LQ340_004654 [Diploschistes diacapsis]
MGPFLSGTEPPVSGLEDVDKLGTDEEHFRNARTADFVDFVRSNFYVEHAYSELISDKFFFVIDARTAKDASVLIVELLDPDRLEPEELETHDDGLTARTTTESGVPFEAVRIGLNYGTIAETLEYTSCSMSSLRGSLATDGVCWGDSQPRKDPPPMAKRLSGLLCRWAQSTEE